MKRASSKLASFRAKTHLLVRVAQHRHPRQKKASVNPARIKIGQNMSTVTEVVGKSGRRYSIQKVLQQKEHSARQVYLSWYAVLKKIDHHKYLEAEFWPQC